MGGTRRKFSTFLQRLIVQQEIKHKEKVVRNMCKQYASRKINEEELKFCLYSITDNNNFLNANSLPIEKIINYLRHFFDPDHVEGT